MKPFGSAGFQHFYVHEQSAFVFRLNGIRFHFFSNEGNPREPIHIHAQRGECLAKIWIQPEPRLAENFGFSPTDLRVILEQVSKHMKDLERGWNEYFS